MQTSILFTNISDRDFALVWAKETKVFKPGQAEYLPDYLAQHGAKHLADQILNFKNIPTDNPCRNEIIASILSTELKSANSLEHISALQNVQIQKEPVTSEVKPFCSQCDSKGVRHKSICPTQQPKEEFAGLKNAIAQS